MKLVIPLLFFLLSSCEWDGTTYSEILIVDSTIFVVGKVIDEDRVPVSDVTVSIGNENIKTDSHGCFLFDYDDVSHPINLTIFKAGYSDIKENKPYSAYYVRSILTKTDSIKTSRVDWIELDIENPNLWVDCEGKNLEQFRVIN